MTSLELPTTVDALADLARERLRAALAGADRVGLVNFPFHGNPGDPAIWLGTRALLAELRVRVVYASAAWGFDPAVARRALGDAPLLLNGGGNLGDLYRGQQQTREEVLRSMPDTRVLQLPQSIRFAEEANAAAFARLVSWHGGFTLMTRENASTARARELFGLEPIASPDHALGLRRLPTTTPRGSERDLLWLSWRPGALEWRAETDPPADANEAQHVDWTEAAGTATDRFDAAGRRAWLLGSRIRDSWPRTQRHHAVLGAMAATTFAPLARRWVAEGAELLAGSRVVVTNKLHGHLLAALLGIPHVVLDNSYGKVHGTVDTWTGGLPGVHRATEAKEALAIARRLLAESRG
ncbi:polysaccharide pyruvyl transferase family protein [Microbacteriaceae bacterium VKM Ac-2854]|nr:polysaccharide pyruvyl transferase family protein [Microbacteriaceae bacterium VKM Ac-2854]